MGKSVADFLKTANEEEIINRENIFKRATRGVGLEMLEIPGWAKTIFDKYLNLEFDLDKMLKEIKNTASKENNLQKLLYIGVLCGRIEEHGTGRVNISHYIENRRMKIKDVPSLAKEHDFTFAFCTFLDDFKRAYNKYGLIKEEPLKTDYLAKRDYCVLAAAAHKLASDNDIPAPEWVFKPEYVLDTPYYAFDTNDKKYQQFLRDTSHSEYAKRNIFFGENVLLRV